jgi:AAA domain
MHGKNATKLAFAQECASVVKHPGAQIIAFPPLTESLLGFGERERQHGPKQRLSDRPARRDMRFELFDDAATSALEEPTNPLIEGLLDEGALSVIYGDSGSGKTFVALDLGFHVASGRPWNGKQVAHGLVVYIAAEGGRRIKTRLAALKAHFKPNTEPLLALVRYPIDLRTSDANLQELIALVRTAERQVGKKCVWVIVDTLSRAIAGGDENSSIDMGRIVVAADRIRAGTGAHFSFVHHTGKDALRGARGHSLLRAATDTEIETTANILTVTKQRDLAGGLAVSFGLVDQEIGRDDEGKVAKSAVVAWDAAAETTARTLKSDKPSNHGEVLRHAIADAYERLADAVERSPGLDGQPVKKVRVDAIRAELKDRGFLDTAENGRLTGGARESLRRAKASLLDSGKYVETDGAFWRVMRQSHTVTAP